MGLTPLGDPLRGGNQARDFLGVPFVVIANPAAGHDCPLVFIEQRQRVDGDKPAPHRELEDGVERGQVLADRGRGQRVSGDRPILHIAEQAGEPVRANLTRLQVSELNPSEAQEEKILDALEWEDTDSAATLEERKEALEQALTT